MPKKETDDESDFNAYKKKPVVVTGFLMFIEMIVMEWKEIHDLLLGHHLASFLSLFPFELLYVLWA